LNTKENVINLHRMQKESSEIHNRVSVEMLLKKKNGHLVLVYTPGVTYIAAEISNNKELVYDYTSK
jgi:malic enzyme